MNRTFKVVFNRARAGLMVANEITSSVQKKGTKTVVAVAALGLMAMFAQANASGYADAIWDKSSGIPTNSYSGVFENKDDWFAALCAKDGASGDLSNLTIKKTGDSAQQLFGLAVFDNANFNLTGESVTVNLSTGGVGGGDNALAGIYTEVSKSNDSDPKTKVGISAKNVSVETTSTHSNGKSVYGVASYGGEVSFTGESVTLTTSTSTERKASDNQYSETAGLLVGTYGGNYGAGKVTFSDSTKLNVNVESKSSKPTVLTQDEKSDRSGGSPAFGIKVDGGTLEAKGSTTLTVKSNGANATGLQLSATNYQSSTGTHDFSSTATINNLTAYATSQTGSAYGVRVQSTSGQDVKLNLSGDVSVSANASGAYKARAIQASDGGQISIDAGKVKAESSSIGIIALGKDAGTKIDIKAKELTVNADYGIWLQNNTETSTDKEKATAVTVNADKTVITGKESGLLAFSSSCLTINSDLAVTATKVMDVRGNSTVNINQDGKKSTVLKGDVVFETPNSPEDSQNSGKLINAYVNVNLTGEDSSWTGRSYQEYKIDGEYQKLVGLEGDASYHGNVTGFNLTVADGAKWVLTDSSFVNTLTLKGGGIIDATNAKKLNVGVSGNNEAGITVKGKGNKLTLGKGTDLSGTIRMEDRSELITPLDTAFKEITKESDVITGGAGRLNIIVIEPNPERPSAFATLTINDTFTLTTGAFTQFGEAYESVALNLANATLKLDQQSEQPIVIPTDVALGAITDKKDVNVNGMKLTISGNGKESSIGTLDFGGNDPAGDPAGEFAARNNTIVNVEKLTGSGYVYVGEPGGAGAKMFINNLEMGGGHIFVDPIHGHSVLGVNELGTNNTLTTRIIAGDGALVTIGTTSETEARAALAKVEGAGSARSVVFMKKAITIGQGGSFYIDPEAIYNNNNGQDYLVHVRAGGLLAVDQGAVGDSPVFGGAALVHFDGGKLAVVNAAPGTLTLVANSSQTPPDRCRAYSSESRRSLAGTCGRSRPDG